MGAGVFAHYSTSLWSRTIFIIFKVLLLYCRLLVTFSVGGDAATAILSWSMRGFLCAGWYSNNSKQKCNIENQRLVIIPFTSGCSIQYFLGQKPTFWTNQIGPLPFTISHRLLTIGSPWWRCDHHAWSHKFRVANHCIDEFQHKKSALYFCHSSAPFFLSCANRKLPKFKCSYENIKANSNHIAHILRINMCVGVCVLCVDGSPGNSGAGACDMDTWCVGFCQNVFVSAYSMEKRLINKAASYIYCPGLHSAHTAPHTPNTVYAFCLLL